MKVIRIKTIEQAKKVLLPPIPDEIFEAGQNLQKRATEGGMGRHAILRDLYDVVDQVGALVDPFTVCSEGCSACCTIPVLVTELEASYIERNTGVRMAQGVRSSRESAPGRCNLLTESGRCSVYAHRPFVCRVFAAFDDPKFCAEQTTLHVTYTPSSNAIFSGAAQWIRVLNARAAIADIRVFFPVKTQGEAQ